MTPGRFVVIPTFVLQPMLLDELSCKTRVEEVLPSPPPLCHLSFEAPSRGRIPKLCVP